MTGPGLVPQRSSKAKVKRRENELKQHCNEVAFVRYKEAVEENAKLAAERRATLQQVVRHVFIALAVISLVGIAAHLIRTTHPPFLYSDGWYIALAGLIGASLGGSELVSRYRDEPLNALLSWAGLTYVSLNAFTSACAYGLLARYSGHLMPQLGEDHLLRAIIAGLGAMAILRSKFFTLRTEKGEDVGVGPDAALSAFLSAADRGVDRKRAGKRLKLVFGRVAMLTEDRNATGGSAPLPVKDFIRVSLSAFQNLGEQEKADIKRKMDEIYDKENGDYPSEELRLQALCYEILVIAGEYNFSRLMKNLEKFLEHLSKAESAHRQKQEVKEKEECLKKTLHGETMKVDAYEAAS